MAIFTLRNRPERGDIGVGSFLNANHEGPTKRPTEKNVEKSHKPERKKLTEVNKAAAKNALTRAYLSIHEKAPPQNLRKVSLELRKETGKHLSPEETKNVLGRVAISLALKDTEFSVNIPETPNPTLDLTINGDNYHKRVCLEIMEGTAIQLRENSERPNSETQTLEIGEDTFDITTGEPKPELRTELEQLLQSD